MRVVPVDLHLDKFTKTIHFPDPAMTPVLRAVEQKLILRNQSLPWVTYKGEFKISLKNIRRHKTPAGQDTFVGPENVLLIVPFQSQPALEVRKPALRAG